MSKSRKDQRSRGLENNDSSQQNPLRDKSSRSGTKYKLHHLDVTDYDELDTVLDELPAFEKI